MLRNPAEAQDVMQISYIKLFENFKQVSFPVSYLYKICYHSALAEIKKRKKRETIQQEYFLEKKDRAYHLDEPWDKNNLFEQITLKLPPKYQLAIQLKVVEHKSYKQIATIMETSEKAVESILVRARRIMKKNLKLVQENKKFIIQRKCMEEK